MIKENNNKLVTFHNGKAAEVLNQYKSNYFDTIITDCPYGISFMNKEFDKQVPSLENWREILRVMKPGGLMFTVFSSRSDVQRDLLNTLEEAGFDIGFSQLYWTYASGMMKGTNLSKALDEKLGVDRPDDAITEPVSEIAKDFDGTFTGCQTAPAVEPVIIAMKPIVPVSRIQVFEALDKKYDYWITKSKIKSKRQIEKFSKKYSDSTFNIGDIVESCQSLNPEKDSLVKLNGQIINTTVFVNSNFKSYITTAIVYNTACSWVDLVRIPRSDIVKNTLSGNFVNEGWDSPWRHDKELLKKRKILKQQNKNKSNNLGGMPSNLLVLDKVLDNGKEYQDKAYLRHSKGKPIAGYNINTPHKTDKFYGYEDLGGYSKFFDQEKWFKRMVQYLPPDMAKQFPFLQVNKPAQYEKHTGLKDKGNIHPTVKPVILMLYLIKMAVGGNKKAKILDPFAGSGTTNIAATILGFESVGIDLEAKHIDIALARTTIENIQALKEYEPISSKLPKPKKKDLKEFF